MHSFVKPGLFHISAETTECLIFWGVKTFQNVAWFFLVAIELAILAASTKASTYSPVQKSIENWSVCSKMTLGEVGVSLS